ncbi:MAG: hypothetical protein EBZ67_02665 [Chitinophagia bacterium]|nr:hypothetical protein [Chitinophagia bacterium]
MSMTKVPTMIVQAMLAAVSVAAMFAPRPVAAQNDSSRSRDGIIARYTLQLLEKGDRNDRYRVVLTAENTNPYEVLYGKPVRKQPDGSMGMNTGDDRSFARVRIYNSSGFEGFLGQTASLAGEDTRLQAEGDVQLFRIAAGVALRTEMDFTVRSGKTPNMLLMLDGGIKKRDDFRVRSGMTGSSGNWVSDCGAIGMFLTITKNTAGQTILEQTVNNRRQTWVQVSEGIFEKAGDNTARVTYNKAVNIYTYSNEDGATCIWRMR